ncbi:MAG: BirA family transcriptional regulator [Actinomycetota bacterium]|nr:BirA family transcriptional regulator [Actinomycetota bacterium]
MPAPSRISELGRWRIHHFEELDSTNRYLLDQARGGAPDGLVAVADVQTAGRGRRDRRWEAPPGSSMLVSVLLRSPSDAGGASAGRAVMAAGVALTRAVEQVAGVSAALKWPNDLVVGDRKLAGLLAERDGEALVVGSGCNVNWESFPPELAASATACNFEAGRPVDRDALLVAYLSALADALADPPAVLDAYRDRLATLGRRVRVEQAGAVSVEGEATAVGDDGALVVRDDTGLQHTITAADVVHLCPA